MTDRRSRFDWDWPIRSMQPRELPPAPWRYSLTPTLMRSLVRAAEHVGEVRALPISFLRRVDLQAEARKARILGRTAQDYSSVTAREVEAVLRGAVLAGRRRGVMERVRASAIVEDALDQYPPSGYLTPELARAYDQALSRRFSESKRVWSEFSRRQRRHLLCRLA